MHICRNNQCPARGRKSNDSNGFPISQETINAPPGDGKFNGAYLTANEIRKQSTPR